jgi:signal transduction histidine kinase
MKKILLISFFISYKKAIRFSLVISLLFCVFKTYSQPTDSLLNKADSLLNANNFTLAYKTYLNIYKKATQEKDYKNAARAERGIGACYYYMHDQNNALKWFYNYYNTVNTNKIDTFLSDAFYVIGAIYIERENLDSVKKYCYPAIELMKKEKNYSRLSRTYATLAELHINKTKDENKIEHYLNLAQSYADSSGSKGMMAFAATKFYNYYFRVKRDYRKALFYVTKAEKLNEEIGNREAITNSYRGKADCLIMLKDTLAKEYIKKWFEYKDSIFDLQKAEEIAKYEELYQAEKREAENQRLQQENQINELRIANRNRTIYLLALILFLIVMTSIWWINRTNIKKKEQQLLLIQKSQKEKERIARDLHDNVGGQLSYLITNLEWLANHPEKIKNEDELKKLLLNYSATGRNAILTLRETIWAVNNEKLSIIDFADRFKNYVLKLQIKNNVKIDFIENFKKPENILMPEQALNIFRICQEAFHNALKHSKANQINILFESSDKCLFKFTVEDNGIGFDYDKRYKDGHYGMKNMEERAKEANAEIEIISSINNGTKISICVKYLNANEVLQ